MNEHNQRRFRVLVCACVGGALSSIGIVCNILLRYAFGIPYASTNALIADSFTLVFTGLIAAVLMLRLWRLAAWDVEHHTALVNEVRNSLQIISYAAWLHEQQCAALQANPLWYKSIHDASDRISTSLLDIEPQGARLLKWKHSKRVQQGRIGKQ